MGTYLGKVQIDNGSNLIAFGDTLYGICATSASQQAKDVALAEFDNVVNGISVRVKFLYGNTAARITLKVGTADRYNVEGDCTCSAGDILSFTWETEGNSGHWIVTTSGLNDVIKEYIDDITGQITDIFTLKGTIGTGGTRTTLPTSEYSAGWAYQVITAGQYGLGQLCEPGDFIVATTSASASQSSINAGHWTVLQGNIERPIQGPQSATNGHVAIFDDASTIMDSGFILGTNVPANAIFTDTDENVLQTGASDNKQYPILFKNSESLSDETDAVRYVDDRTTVITINPSTGRITAPGGFAGVADSALSVESVDWSDITNIPSLADLREALGISQAMTFIGQVASNSAYKPSDGGTQVPTISGQTYTTPKAGDVVLDDLGEREYVWDGTQWCLLGYTASTVYQLTVAANQQIEELTQATDGTVRATLRTLDSNSSWPGYAAKLTNSNLGTHIKPIYLVGGVATECNTYAGGTKTILNDVNLSGDTATFYAPLTGGNQYQILVSGTRSEDLQSVTDPQWAPAAYLESLLSTAATGAYTTLTLGNNKADTVVGNSEGRIILYSANTQAHVLSGDSTTAEYNHILPNASGYLAQIQVSAPTSITDSAVVGSPTQPIYVGANGILTPLTYTANRLYYSASTTSFAATGHYASDTQIGLGTTTMPVNSTDTLYVDGTTTLDDDTEITGILTISDDTEATSSIGGALIVNGGVSIAKNTRVIGALYVDKDSYLNGSVGIGAEPDTTPAQNNDHDHILTIGGSVLFLNSTSDIAHMDEVSVSDIATLHFFPESSDSGSIGLENHKWATGYFSTLLDVGNEESNIFTGVRADATGVLTVSTSDSSIIMDTVATISTTAASYTMTTGSAIISLITEAGVSSYDTTLTLTANAPTILLDSITANATDWTIINDNGIFSINNSGNPLIELSGTDNGFELTNRLYIGETIPAQPDYTLYVNGDMAIGGHIIPIQTIDSAYSLGSTTNRWSALYIGSADTHGDAFTPIYWNEGVPTTVVPVQKLNWNLASSNKGCKIQHTTMFTGASIVVQIVVTSGESNLNAPLTWKSGDGWIAINTSVAVSGAVSGYVLVIRGAEYADNEFTYSLSSTEY